MYVNYYNHINALYRYEEFFNAEYMPIKFIAELPKWAKKVIYVVMNKGRDIVAFARVQQVMPNLYDIQDVFIFSKFRGCGLCSDFISTIVKTAPVSANKTFIVSLLPDNEPAFKCYKRAKFVEIGADSKLAVLFNKFWKRIDFIHMAYFNPGKSLPHFLTIAEIK